MPSRWMRDAVAVPSVFGHGLGSARSVAAPGAGDPGWGLSPDRGGAAQVRFPYPAKHGRAFVSLRGARAPPRRHTVSWPAFLRRHAASLLACDFVTVETVSCVVSM